MSRSSDIFPNAILRKIQIMGILLCFLGSTQIFSQSRNYFDELTSDRKPILGSDKEDKYVVRLPPLIMVENWGPHYSLHSLLFSYTNYPKFKEVSVLPFYNYLWAKNDDSYRTYLFPIYFAQRMSSNGLNSGLNLSLFHFNSYESGANYSKETYRFPSFFPLAGSETKVENGKESSFRYALPFLFFRKKNTEDDWTHFLLFHWGKNDRSSYGAILPLLFWGKGEDRFHSSFLPLWYYDRNDTEKTRAFLTPLFGRTWKERGEKEHYEEERFTYFLAFFRYSSYKNGELQTSHSFLPIVWNRKFAKGSGTSTNALLLSGWNSDANGDYKGFYFFPFFFHSKSEYFFALPAYMDFGSEKIGLLPIPFYHKKNATETKFYILNSYYSENWKGERNFLFFPLFYRFSDASQSTTIAPFFYRNSEGAGSANYFINTYYSRNQKGDLDRIVFFPFVSYKANESFLLFPIFYRTLGSAETTTITPLFYRNSEGLRSKNYFLNTYVSWDSKGELDRTVFFPFVFYKAREYFHVVPLYFDTGKERFGIFPLPFYHYDDSFLNRFYILNSYYSANKSGEWSFLFFPLWYNSKTQKGNTYLAPFYYRNSEGLGSENYAINTYLSWDRKGELERGVFFPFVFYKSNDYLSVLPFVVKGNQQGKEYILLPPLLTYWDKDQTWILNTYSDRNSETGEYRQFTFFPFWSYSKEKENRSYLLFPFFHHKTSEKSSRTISLLSYSYKTPEEEYSLYGLYEKYDSEKVSTRKIYPVFFSGSDDKGSYWNLAGLAGRGFDKQGEAEYSYAVPFLYFYKRDSYRLSLPFFIRLGYDDKHYTHFGIFHYWNRSPEKDNTWIWPLLWVSNVDKVRKEDFTTWFPLYWNWNTPRSKGDIFLPFYLNYEEADKSLQLILAYSYSQSLGSFGASAGIGSTEKEYYIDTDLAVLYNLFSVSKRTSIPKDQLLWWREHHPEEEAVKTGTVSSTEKPKTEEKEGISRYNRLTRENVRSFWGVGALFGIFSYEEGDDRRHLRLLPLSWFSWSKKSDEKVYAAPFFFWSRIADESYFVLFPFYGRQDQGPDYLESYLLLGFLRGKQGQVKDYSFLWPITRFYTSPDSWGFRIFPLVAHDQSSALSRTISPLYYRKRMDEGPLSTKTFHSIALPLLHYGSETTTTKEGVWQKGYDTILPFYFRMYSSASTPQGESKNSYVITLLSVYGNKAEIDGGSYTSFLSPFYFFKDMKGGKGAEGNSARTDFFPIPGLYWDRSPVHSTFFLLGFYREKSEKRSITNFAFLFQSSEIVTGNVTEEEFYIAPFYFSQSEKEGDKIVRYSKTIPLFYFSSMENEKKSWNAMGIFYGSSSPSEDAFGIFPFYSNRKEKTEKFRKQTIWGIPYYYFKRDTVDGDWDSVSFNPFYVRVSAGTKTSDSDAWFWFLPIPALYYEKNVSTEGIVDTELSFLKLISYKKKEDTLSFKKGGKEFSALLLLSSKSEFYEDQSGKYDRSESYLFPVFWFDREKLPASDKTHLNFLVLFDYSNETSSYESSAGKGTKESFRISPFYFSSSEKEGEKVVRSSVTVPVFYHGTAEGSGKTWNVLGLLNGSKSDTEDSFAVYPFYSNTKIKEKNSQTQTIWGIPFYYEKSEYPGGNWNSLSLNPLGVFNFGGSKNSESESWFLFLPIPALYYEKNVSTLGIVDREINFLKLITYTSSADIRSGTLNKAEFSALFLISTKSETYENQFDKYKTLQSYFFPLYWYSNRTNATGSRTNLNFLILFDFIRDSGTNESRTILGPLFSYSDKNSEAWGLLPLVFRKKEESYNFWFALGAYGYSDKESNRWGFAGIIDTSYENAFKRRNLNLFLGLIHAELEEERTRIAILGGLGDYESRPNYSSANFLWLGWSISPGDNKQNFFPLYYYHRDADGMAAMVPPVLGYFSSDKDGRFDLLGMGLLYYRNQKISREEDMMFVGPGLFYYRQYPTEMGLHSMGVLALPLMGGLLWDWEYETRSRYSRYSILNFIYSHTTTKDGNEFSRILGIKIQ